MGDAAWVKPKKPGRHEVLPTSHRHCGICGQAYVYDDADRARHAAFAGRMAAPMVAPDRPEGPKRA